MDKIKLGKTGIMATRPAFGALPIQRRDKKEAVEILRAAYDAGITYYDTANMYSDSEEKLGLAFEGMRENVTIATKTGGTDKETVTKHIENSLRMLKTDYLDLIQFHNTPKMLDLECGAWDAVREAKQKGYVRHIGATSHQLPVAMELVERELIETIQYPFSYLASDSEIELVKKCAEKEIGFIAMKGLAGGFLTNAQACHAFMLEHPNVVPIWGIQHMWELEQWIQAGNENVRLNDELRAVIQKDRDELVGSFCRCCGYCLPCPVDIDIPQLARLNRLLRRSPWEGFYNDFWKSRIDNIDNCVECGDCASRCPYGLKPYELVKANKDDYYAYYKEMTGKEFK